jgi:serine/threonine protein kinase
MRPLQPPTTDDLLRALHAARLLPPARLESLAGEWADSPGSVADRAGELVECGLLTAYQGEQVLAGKARQLKLGQYRLLDRLGAGGMGQVYKAEHLLMKRVVALKVILRVRRPAGGKSSGRKKCVRAAGTGAVLRTPEAALSVERFRREVEAAARLCHPNIVTAYDAAEARGLHFLVMEYVEGLDLERLLVETGPLPVPLVAEAVRQTALALQYAHERGLVHRDVKPSNLLLARPSALAPADTATPLPGSLRPERPLIKLLDLGLARLAHTAARAGDDRSSDPLAGEALSGTPDYMAPERGHDPDHADIRSDLYSLGCTAYHLLTGRVPFPGGSWTEKLLRHRLDAPLPLRDLRPDVPEPLATVVQRLLAREPEDRYPAPAAVAAALAEPAEINPATRPALSERRASCLPSVVGRRGAWPAVVAAVAAGLLVSVGVRWLLLRTQPSPGAEQSPSPLLAIPTPYTFAVEDAPGSFRTLAQAIASAPDGATITVHGSGPHTLAPLSLDGKGLTVRAAPGARPCLTLAPGAAPWQALLGTDRSLTLEGLELRADGGPVVCCNSSTLRLRACHLTHTGRGAAVVVRNVTELNLGDCVIEADDVALSAEVGGGGPCRLHLADSRLTARQRSGAAVSLWAPEVHRPAAVELRLEGSTLTADRAIAGRALPGALTVAADGSTFSFRDALLSLTGGEGWRASTRWRGRENTYRGSQTWLRIDGASPSVGDLAAWRDLWDSPESGSRQE